MHRILKICTVLIACFVCYVGYAILDLQYIFQGTSRAPVEAAVLLSSSILLTWCTVWFSTVERTVFHYLTIFTAIVATLTVGYVVTDALTGQVSAIIDH